MKLLVTGSGGMLGGELVEVARRAGHSVTGLDHSQLDLSDPVATEEAIRASAPDAIINCAAWTDVDLAESHELEATEVNGVGAGNVAEAAERAGAIVCQISTDYVFDGRKPTAYVESDQTAPIQAYGRSKLAGEQAVLQAATRSFVVRTSWLFGLVNRRPNFVETMLRLSSGDQPVRVVSDQVGCPTWTGHLAEGILRLIEQDDYGVHHMAATGSCSWFDFASAIFAQAGLEPELIPVESREFDRPARRPANSVMVSEWETPVVLPEWEKGLEEYLAEREMLDREDAR